MEEVKTEVDTVEAEDAVEEDDIAGVEGFDYYAEEDDLEYDDDGNVVIPDDDADADTTAEEEEPPKEEPDPRDAEIERLRKSHEKLEAQAKNTLKALGWDGEDAVDGLAEIAAESIGKTKEEYVAERDVQEKLQEEERAAKQKALDEVMAEDLAEIKASFPDAEKYDSVLSFPNVEDFARLRAAGISAKTAFAASHLEYVGPKAKPTADSKSHLRSSVPKVAKDTSTHIPADELETFRDLFPKASDKELASLYKRATKTN